MANDKTPHYELPLPHRENLLSEDVDRIRDSFIAVDEAIYDAARSIEELVEEERKARAAEKEKTDAQLKKLRTLALAGL
jgi:hypothetical protein|nr:MAG TPA: hypothetical protein [Caudoviricetes sp.]